MSSFTHIVLEAVSLNSTTVIDCLRSLNEMTEEFNRCLIWVLGHGTIIWVCKTDNIACKYWTTLDILDEL